MATNDTAPEASTSAIHKRHRAQRTSMVPMRSSSQISTATGTSLRNKESRRSRPQSALSATDLSLQRSTSAPYPLRDVSDSNDTSATEDEVTMTYGESSIPISISSASRRRSSAKGGTPNKSPVLRTTGLPRDEHSPLSSPSRSPTNTKGNWMYSSSPSRSRPTTAGSSSGPWQSTSTRARSSQATSAAPFEYDASGSENEESKLERQFMAAIERRRRSNSPELRYLSRQSMPSTARTTDTFAAASRASAWPAESSSLLGQTEQAAASVPTSLSSPHEGNVVLRGSRYTSGASKTDWAIPLSTESPFGSVEDGGKVRLRLSTMLRSVQALTHCMLVSCRRFSDPLVAFIGQSGFSRRGQRFNRDISDRLYASRFR